MSESVFERFKPQAEVWITPESVTWNGPEDGMLPVTYQALDQGLMELLYEFGPFEVVGDAPDRDVRYFRRMSCSKE